MSRFFQALRRAGGARAGGRGVQEADVQRWGLTGIKLRPYQLEGINWLVQCSEVQHGCILGDEMGLGKTCQAIQSRTASKNYTPYSALLSLGTSVPREQVKEFAEYYQIIEKESESAKELHSLLQPFLLRRVKSEVAVELPKKLELVLYHGMSALQKEYYKAILTKDLDAFENETGKKVTLQNVLIQLRKCVAHPYLFSGLEPEPFEIGDHIVEASGKMCLLDNSFHSCMLGYSYEQLDGSVRGEERHLAIKNFGQQPIFIFLLSTRAGKGRLKYKDRLKTKGEQRGFCGFIFQLQPHTVLSMSCIQGGNFLSEILKFGLDKLLFSEGSTIQDVELQNILGETKGGQWIMDTVLPQKEENDEEDTENHMYVYEGKDYSKEPSREDKKAFDQLLNLQKALIEKTSKEGRALRNKANLGEGMLKDLDASVLKLSLESGLDNSAILLTDLRYAVQDDSGRWGRGGLFTALEARSDQPRKIYEMAEKMKDLELGGTLLFPIDKISRKKGQDLLALIVAQHRDWSNNLSGIKLSALEKGLKKIYLAAKKRNATVHLPQIGYATKGFNWYGTERLIRKHLATRGVPTLMYPVVVCLILFTI
ncbi:hypothetical protein TURU_031985 [Turdus rufiventris]|nr:hypothetical protein TURU_031985 [Turdus rufiventris]